MLTADVTGLSEVVLHLRVMPDEIRASIMRAVDGEAVRLEGMLRDEVLPSLPIKHGATYQEYQDSIFSSLDETSTSIIATVGTRGVVKTSKYGSVNLAAIFEYGSVAHIIRARFAQALRFTLGGTVMFRKQVNHPGTKAHRPITGLLAREAATIRANIEAAAKEGLPK